MDLPKEEKSLSEPPVSETVIPQEGIVVPERFITGWKLGLLTLSISLSMFIVNIEVSVVATSLVSIGNALGSFDRIGWIVTGYLTTYTSLVIIWSKFSDFFGRKTCLISALILFTAFSGGCGAAQNINQLIVCRAFQGIGAAGCASLGFTIGYEMVPMHDYPKYAALISSANIIGSLVGPIIGGALSDRASWRWIFLFTIPLGIFIIVLVIITIPNGFPNQHQYATSGEKYFQGLSTSIRDLDVLGAFLLLAWSMLFVTALLESGVSFAWNSDATICLFIFAGILLVLFLWWEFRISKSQSTRLQPIFPFRFLTNRPWMGVLLLSLLSGAPYIVTIIDIPQRYQTFGHTSALGAGLRLIPFNGFISFGLVAVNIIASKSNLPPIAFLSVGTVLQITGVSLLSTVTDSTSVPSAVYGYQILTGLGIGIIMGLTVVLPPVVAKDKDLALCAGAVLQFRMLGGSIALAIATAAMNNHATKHLRKLVTVEEVSAILDSTAAVSAFTDPPKGEILDVLLGSYNQRMKTLIGFTTVQVLALGMLWSRPQVKLPKKGKQVVVEGTELEGKQGA